MADIARETNPTRNRLGPYSRKLHRGAIGDAIDGRSALGRFVRSLEAELTAHVGGKPSIVQRLLIDRIIRIRLQLDALDEKLAGGNWTPHDGRTHGGLMNAYRLTMRELGIKAVADRQPTLAEALAAHAARKAQDGGDCPEGDDDTPEADQARQAEPQATPDANGADSQSQPHAAAATPSEPQPAEAAA